MAEWDDDPDLRLTVDGRTVRPRSADRSVARFDLPAGACEVRVVSRSLIPAEHDPAAADLRRLGVSIRHIALRSAHLDIDVPPGDAALAEGWHPAEEGHRWTDGAALLPPDLLGSFDETLTVELHLNPVRLRYPPL